MMFCMLVLCVALTACGGEEPVPEEGQTSQAVQQETAHVQQEVQEQETVHSSGEQQEKAAPEVDYNTRDFWGTWVYQEFPGTILIRDDMTWTERSGEGGVICSGFYSLGEDCLQLFDENGSGETAYLELFFTGDGNLMDSYGDFLGQE